LLNVQKYAKFFQQVFNLCPLSYTANVQAVQEFVHHVCYITAVSISGITCETRPCNSAEDLWRH